MSLWDSIKSSLGAQDTSYLAASRTAREVFGWEASTGDADSDINDGLETITSRARDLDRNSGLAQNLKNTKRDNLIGVGLTWQPTPNWRVLDKTQDWAHEYAKHAKAHMTDYFSSRHFDAEGQLNFPAMARLVHDSRFTNGAACVVPMWEEGRIGTRYRTCFKLIESDRLSNKDNAADSELLSAGVQKDKKGVVTHYHVANKHPGSEHSDGSDKWERVPAFYPNGRRGFIHVYHRERPGQSRGVAAIASVMAVFGLRSKYQLTEVQAAEVTSRIAGIMETPLTDDQAQMLFGGKPGDYAKLRSEWNGKLTSGMILKLPPGTKFTSHNPSRAAAPYIGFMDHVGQEIGLAVGLPDQLSRRDFTKVNYSSARGALLEAWRGFYVERAELMYQFGDPVLELVLEDAIDLGVFDGLLTLEEFNANRSACIAGKWLGKGMSPIDRLKHENANKIALEIGTTTLMDVYAEDGEDWEDKEEQRYREAALKLENRYRMAAYEATLKEQYSIELTTDTPPEGEEEEPPNSDEEIDEQDEQEEEATPEQDNNDEG